MAEDSTPAVAVSVSPQTPIVARADSFTRWKRLLIVAVLFGYGLWSLYDGFYHFPHDNAVAKAHGFDQMPHPAYDIPMNQGFGILLPPLSIVMLAWFLYGSRGEIRFDGSTLSMPGHPPIPLNALRKMDRSKWDRKGIAVFDYQLPGEGATGQFKLDDFVYDRKPIDQIFAALEAAITAAAKGVAVASTGRPGEGLG